MPQPTDNIILSAPSQVGAKKLQLLLNNIRVQLIYFVFLLLIRKLYTTFLKIRIS